MTGTPPRPEYHLRLRAEPGMVPAVVRLRRFLKAALRSYGLRCVEVREVAPGVGRAPNRSDDAGVG